MTQTPAQIGNLTYNAAEERFEALVTFYTDAGRLRVPSRYPAPLNAEFPEISRGLMSDAMRARQMPDRLRSRLRPSAAEPQRQPRKEEPRPRRAFDWLRLWHGDAA
ncbi:hypothetical protein [Salipiger abyssi]|uniref:Uncharacterized protein n=1 Tax=Salipiger abyssi TaxID=1250539 RepID=A0A1P8USF1_9RHOB|nr:hypothetical protein [Salipiger abyssi]APZ52335.1 hypothetical protein Ga0080574_TMP2001 [Salipiger abyssi]